MQYPVKFRGGKEVYDYEVTDTPISEIEKQKRGSPRLTNREILAIARAELSKAGLKGIQVKMSRYQGKDELAPYSDATHWSRDWEHATKKQHRIHLHPLLCYQTPEYVREVIWHEIEHILGEERA